MSLDQDTSVQEVPSVTQMKSGADAAGRALRSLSNPSRLLILCALVERELSVSELQSRLDLTQAYVSQQLARLRKAGFVEPTRDGRFVRYRLSDGRVEPIIRTLHHVYCS